MQKGNAVAKGNDFNRRDLLKWTGAGAAAALLGVDRASASGGQTARPSAARFQAQQYADVTLRVLTQAGVAYEPALKAYAGEFQKNTGAKIEFDFAPWEQLMPKIQADLSAGSPTYDMFCDDIEFQYTIYPSLLPINDLITSRKYDMDGFFQPVYTSGEGVAGGLKGTRFGLPISAGASWVFYRTDLIETFPTTWADYAKVIAEHTGNGMYGLSFAGVSAQLVKLFLARYWSQGDPLLTPDWKPLINSDKGVKAAEMLQEHMKYADPGVLGWDNPDASNAFVNGDAAVMEGWSSFILPSLNDPAKSKVVGKWSVAAYPEKGTGNFTQHNFVILKSTKNPYAAFDFMAYCTGPDTAVNLMLDYQNDSPRKTAWNDPQVVKERPYAPLATAIYDAGKPFTPGLPQWLQLFTNLGDGLSGALSGQQKVPDALNDVAKQWDDAIKQAKPDFDYKE
jgi:ABC-type glycerol-3-phosphate transport system substrate-binding protein